MFSDPRGACWKKLHAGRRIGLKIRQRGPVTDVVDLSATRDVPRTHGMFLGLKGVISWCPCGFMYVRRRYSCVERYMRKNVQHILLRSI